MRQITGYMRENDFCLQRNRIQKKKHSRNKKNVRRYAIRDHRYDKNELLIKALQTIEEKYGGGLFFIIF